MEHDFRYNSINSHDSFHFMDIRMKIRLEEVRKNIENIREAELLSLTVVNEANGEKGVSNGKDKQFDNGGKCLIPG